MMSGRESVMKDNRGPGLPQLVLSSASGEVDGDDNDWSLDRSAESPVHGRQRQRPLSAAAAAAGARGCRTSCATTPVAMSPRVSRGENVGWFVGWLETEASRKMDCRRRETWMHAYASLLLLFLEFLLLRMLMFILVFGLSFLSLPLVSPQDDAGSPTLQCTRSGIIHQSLRSSVQSLWESLPLESEDHTGRAGKAGATAAADDEDSERAGLARWNPLIRRIEMKERHSFHDDFIKSIQIMAAKCPRMNELSESMGIVSDKAQARQLQNSLKADTSVKVTLQSRAGDQQVVFSRRSLQVANDLDLERGTGSWAWESTQRGSDGAYRSKGQAGSC